MRGLFGIVALASIAYAQTASVEGLVISSITGAPLARVQLHLKNSADNSGAQYGAQTTEDGHFSITGIAAARSYVLSAERAGFAVGRMSLLLQGDEKRKNITLKLVPVGAISGRILDSAGNPLEHATVTAEGADKKDATTDENGRYRIGGLGPGRYRVNAVRDQMLNFMVKPEILPDGSRQLDEVTTYYPGTVAARQAQRVEVKPDSETMGTDIHLVGMRCVRVSGKVADFPRGAKEAYATIATYSRGMGIPIKADGSFEFWGVDPGKYTLSAGWGLRDSSQVSTGTIRIEVGGANIDNLELRVVPNSDIAGRVITETADGPAPNTQTRVRLGGLNNSGNVGDPAQVAVDGTFQLKQVPAGKYALNVSQDGFYVKSMRLGPTEFDGDILDIMNGSVGADLTVVLSNAVASLNGTVHDAKGNPMEALVILARDRGEETLFESRSTDAQPDGSYSFAGLPPGNYKLAAFPREDAEIVRGPFGLSALDDLMESVEVSPGGKIVMDLKILASH
jgi:uncharacterized protein (DUF2141 family)